MRTTRGGFSPSGAARDLGIYGFAKPGPNSLPLPIAEYRSRSIDSFHGNDRNIAVLARYFTGASLEIVVPQEPDGSIKLLPGTATLHGTSPVVMDNQIGHWDNPDDWVEWTLDVKKPGRFEVEDRVRLRPGPGREHVYPESGRSGVRAGLGGNRFLARLPHLHARPDEDRGGGTPERRPHAEQQSALESDQSEIGDAGALALT